MRGLILAAFSLLLLVSAASATGSDNAVISEVFQSATDTCIVGANLAQASVLDTNLLGCDNYVEQYMDITADDNSIIGTANFEEDEGGDATDGESGAVAAEVGDDDEFFNGANFVQAGEMVFNATGSDNVGYQDIDLFANDNCETFGNFSQMAVQTADAIGCENDIFQDTDTHAGLIPEEAESSGNDFIMSNVAQASLLDACTVGSYNDIDQHAEQDLFDNCVTESAITQEALLVEDVWGCDNSNDLTDVFDEDDWAQSSLQTIDDSSFLQSTGKQAISLNEQVLGDDNYVAQFGETLIDDGCFTMGTTTQSISETFAGLGCDNLADQDATLENIGNSIVGGNLNQKTTIDSNL